MSTISLPVVPSIPEEVLATIFLLTATSAQKEQISDLLHRQESEGDNPQPQFHFLDWTREQDGTVKDIVAIAAQALRTGVKKVIFLDRKSLQDQTVIVSSWNDEQDMVLRAKRVEAPKAWSILHGGLVDLSKEEASHDALECLWTKDLDLPAFSTGEAVKGNDIDTFTEVQKTDLSILTAAPAVLELKSTIIHLIALTTLTGEEEANIKTAVEASHPPVSDKRDKCPHEKLDCRIHSWLCPARRGSRADVYRISNRGKQCNPYPKGWQTFFVDEQTLQTQTVLVSWFYDPKKYAGGSHHSFGLQAARIPLRSVVTVWAETKAKSGRHEEWKQGLETELIPNPDAPLYLVFPSYLPDPRTMETKPPVIFLTQMSPENERVVKAELETLIEGDEWLEDQKKDFAYIPWPHAERDGTEDDLWAIAKGFLDDSRIELLNYIFVDAQSAEDKTVRLTSFDWNYADSKHGSAEPRGLSHIRVPGREASINWVNLDVGNMGLEDMAGTMDVPFIRNPDLPEEPAPMDSEADERGGIPSA